jgi:hypothetical protein
VTAPAQLLIPPLLAPTVTIGPHARRHNALLSIIGGTAVNVVLHGFRSVNLKRRMGQEVQPAATSIKAISLA